MTFEFVMLANEHNIRFFTFIFHLTHCMQSLDVDFFRQYKHWHQRAIQKTVAEPFVNYSLNQFLKNFTKIWLNIFKFFTIRHVFQNSDMWSVNAKRCIEQLKNFSSEFFKKKISLFSYLFHHFHFQQIVDVNYELQKWSAKIQRRIEWSDSARNEKFDSFVVNFKKIIINSMFKKSELKFWRNKKINELHDRRINRKRLKSQNELKLTKKTALFEITVKRQKKKDFEKKNESKITLWRCDEWKKNDLHIKKIVVRKTEKIRVKQMKKMMKGYAFISSKLLIFIHDSKIAWKITNFIWIAEKVKKAAKKNKNIKSIVDENEDEDINIETDDNQSWLQKNFLSLKNENENENV